MSFGRYRVHELVGKGGMGVVYRATDPRLDRLVALKVMAPEWSSDPQFRARFLRESRLAAAIEHPHIVPVYDADEHDGRLYLAMRYIDGGDLRSVVCSDGPLEVQRTAALAAQLASALDAAHRRGVIHRDVKPANALLARTDGDGAGEHVYLADFGIARTAAATTMITSAGGLIGSVMYLAPEVLEGADASPASDRYALACLVYELLCGLPPFVADTDAAVIMAHIAREPEPPSSLRAQLGPAVDEALRWGLAKDPAQRPASCSELVEALTVPGTRRLRTRPPAGAPTSTLAPASDGPGDPTTATLGRRRARAAPVGAIAVLACAAIGVALGTTVAPAESPKPSLRLQLSNASVDLPGWTQAPLPRDLAANLDRTSARAARSPEGVNAAVGSLSVTGDAGVLPGPGADRARTPLSRRLALDTVTVRETVIPSGEAPGTTDVIERRATSGPTLAAVCSGTTGTAVRDACRFVAAHIVLRDVTDLPADQTRRFAVTVRGVLDDADGRLADRTAIAGNRTNPRRRAAARLADAGRTAADELADVEGTGAQQRFTKRLASALRARCTALDAVAFAEGADAERLAAQRLHDAQGALGRLIARATAKSAV